MSIVIFVLLSSQDGFSRQWTRDDEGHRRAPAIYNGAFSTIAFLLGAVTSIASGFFGMKIAVYANARTALEARKGIAPAFMAGTYAVHTYLPTSNYEDLLVKIINTLQSCCLRIKPVVSMTSYIVKVDLLFYER